MSDHKDDEPAFIVDRMLGTLCRYLRFMGYDAVSASSLREGNKKEDTLLIRSAVAADRVLLTKDRELARRAGNSAVLISGDEVIAQIRQLVDHGLVDPKLRLTRCSLCNGFLRPAREHEIRQAAYAPASRSDLEFYWCRNCRKLYWLGSHGKNLEKRINNGL